MYDATTRPYRASRWVPRVTSGMSKFYICSAFSDQRFARIAVWATILLTGPQRHKKGLCARFASPRSTPGS